MCLRAATSIQPEWSPSKRANSSRKQGRESEYDNSSFACATKVRRSAFSPKRSRSVFLQRSPKHSIARSKPLSSRQLSLVCAVKIATSSQSTSPRHLSAAKAVTHRSSSRSCGNSSSCWYCFGNNGSLRLIFSPGPQNQNAGLCTTGSGGGGGGGGRCLCKTEVLLHSLSELPTSSAMVERATVLQWYH